MKKSLVVPILCAIGLSTHSVTYADSFREAGVDTTTSVGKFKVKLVDEYAEKWGVKEIESSRLFDAQTKIGRSTSHLDGSRTDKFKGTRICEDGYVDSCIRFAPTRIKDSTFALIPLINGNFFDDGPNETEEIHTEVLSLNLTDAGDCGTKSANAIRAGNVAPYAARSLGEVESFKTPDSVDSYTAKGFFNLFVEVDVDWNNDGIVDAMLFNNYPIVTKNNDMGTFPSDVVYVHDSNDFAVPVYETATRAHVGWIVIVGQGIVSDCDDNESDKGIFDKSSLSIELTSFTATGNEGRVSLEWKTETEIDCNGYHLWRAKKNEAGEYVEITRLTEQLILSEGGVLDKAIYSYEDSGVMQGNIYYYGLEDVAKGVSTIHLESIVSTTTGGETN